MEFNRQPRGDEATSWLWVGLWVLFIYVTISLARDIQEFIRDQGGKIIFLVATYAALVLACLGIAWFVRTGRLVLSAGRTFVLVLIAGIFAAYTWTLRSNPEEAIHFVQYGVLSGLLFRALHHRLRDPSIYFAATMLGIGFGVIDELIQWIVPRRVFAFRDIGINVLAVVLIQAAIAFGIRPATVNGRVKATGMRYGFAAAAVVMLLLLFCVSNTDGFKAWYTKFIPAADVITEVTAEYGFKIDDPSIGIIYSRMRPEEIIRQDKVRSKEVAEILNRFRADRSYGKFHATYQSHEDPFLVEARVHLFRRDRYAEMAIKNAEDRKLMREYANIAYSENNIVKKYFGETVRRSDFAWPADMEQKISLFCADAPLYRSPVSNSLITRVTRPVLTGFFAVMFLVMIAGERWAARRLPS
jgi:VanZ like family